MNFTQIQPFLDFILIMGLCSGRILGFASMSVFFSQQYITGIARNAVVIALSLVLIPVFYSHGAEVLKDNSAFFICLVIKEVLIGILLGWLSNFIFYIAQSVGFLIDTQRGASMASMFDPLSNSQTSPLGDFLMKFLMVLIIISGLLLVFLELIYWSYEKIPVFTMFDLFGCCNLKFFNTHMGTELLSRIVLLGGPVFFILFLSEFGLVLVTRFAPQLNVFFLSMPIKSELAMFFFILYLSYLTRYFCSSFDANNWVAKFLHLVTQT